MTDQVFDTKRTLSFADEAIEQIRGRNVAATPKNYEIFYNYVSGYHEALSQRINQVLEKSGALTQDFLDALFSEFFGVAKAADRVDSLGSRVVDEIEQVMAMISAASTRTESYTSDLAGASAQLASVSESETVRDIIEALIVSTREIEANNKALEKRLKESRTEIHQLKDSLDAVRTESLTDPLTSLSNRKFYDQAITRAVSEAGATGEKLSVLVIDIDHFKRFNDTYGHLTGDQVLRLVAQALKQNIKGQDIACRYGGEEFVVILPSTNMRDATIVAEHIRRAVMTKELIKRSTGENLGRITISIGVSTFRQDDTIASIYERADQCLYAAKRNGRNRVLCETDPEVTPAKVA